MFTSIIHLIFPSFSESLLAWIWPLADICTILWFILTTIFQNKKIQKLQQQFTNIDNQNSNNNSLEQIQNKNIWYSCDKVLKIIDKFKEDDLWDKYVSKDIFLKLVDVVWRLADTVKNISDIVVAHNWFIKDIVQIIKNLNKITKAESIIWKLIK